MKRLGGGCEIHPRVVMRWPTVLRVTVRSLFTGFLMPATFYYAIDTSSRYGLVIRWVLATCQSATSFLRRSAGVRHSSGISFRGIMRFIEPLPPNHGAANGGITSRLQSTRLVAAVAELLGRGGGRISR